MPSTSADAVPHSGFQLKMRSVQHEKRILEGSRDLSQILQADATSKCTDVAVDWACWKPGACRADTIRTGTRPRKQGIARVSKLLGVYNSNIHYLSSVSPQEQPLHCLQIPPSYRSCWQAASVPVVPVLQQSGSGTTGVTGLCPVLWYWPV